MSYSERDLEYQASQAIGGCSPALDSPDLSLHCIVVKDHRAEYLEALKHGRARVFMKSFRDQYPKQANSTPSRDCLQKANRGIDIPADPFAEILPDLTNLEAAKISHFHRLKSLPGTQFLDNPISHLPPDLTIEEATQLYYNAKLRNHPHSRLPSLPQKKD